MPLDGELLDMCAIVNVIQSVLSTIMRICSTPAVTNSQATVWPHCLSQSQPNPILFLSSLSQPSSSPFLYHYQTNSIFNLIFPVFIDDDDDDHMPLSWHGFFILPSKHRETSKTLMTH